MLVPTPATASIPLPRSYLLDIAGALTVVEGRLVEVEGVLGCPRRRVLPVRGRRTFGTELVHDVVNIGPGEATSIHVYSPPLTSMTFYDPVTLTPVRTEPVAAESPALIVDPASLLHPARRAERRAHPMS